MHRLNSINVPPDHVALHWFGQSSFAFKSGAGTVIQCDPYFPHDRPADRFIHAEPPMNEADLETHFVILTHNHGDHTCIESIQRIHEAFPNCRYVGPSESIENLLDNGIPMELTTEVIAGEEASLGDVTAHVVWAKPPEGVPEDNIEPPGVQHLGFVLAFGVTNLYISGDPINTFANHEELIAPIARLEPDIGILTTHPTEGEFPFFEGSVETAFKLGLRTVVPAHYQCFVSRNYDPGGYIQSFPEDGPLPLIIPYNESITYPV